ncbi:vanadium-dependent haloperoxidase [Actinoplanes sp. CA-015351]|uniref:vanadium-dependent haloperoxidase n=1 Tax=Actinoplanes sp. CA-015351 TaxID=3239897 RepID=UPI003D98C4FC
MPVLTAALVLTPAPVEASGRAIPADAVITWNLHAEEAIWTVARQNPWVQGRSFSMVQGAVYDAVNAIAGTPYRPYLTAVPATGRESAGAAVAAAAYQVLTGIFPEQHDRIRAQYDTFLDGIPDGAAERGGIAIGERTAAAMLTERQGDGAFGVEAFPVGTLPGQWRPTPPTFANLGAWTADLKPFSIPSTSVYRTAGPPALDGVAYARDLNEVKEVGGVNSTVRTADQSDAARWWHDRRMTQWEINRQLIVSQRLGGVQAARLLALVNMAVTDATSACFNEKRHWGFWRPVTAVRLADTDGNAATVADPEWTPLLVTPGSPDYTSGHACATGASMTALLLFFGRDRIGFSATSADTGSTRRFAAFSQALTELINARVWGGIHFRSADLQGARIGVSASTYVFTHEFRRS